MKEIEMMCDPDSSQTVATSSSGKHKWIEGKALGSGEDKTI
jgi:hypothetical protein